MKLKSLSIMKKKSIRALIKLVNLKFLKLRVHIKFFHQATTFNKLIEILIMKIHIMKDNTEKIIKKNLILTIINFLILKFYHLSKILNYKESWELKILLALMKDNKMKMMKKIFNQNIIKDFGTKNQWSMLYFGSFWQLFHFL